MGCGNGYMQKESRTMKALNAIGLHHLAWSARRLHCPVPKDALVLDVGSGGNPYPRANVLLEGSEESEERYYEKLVADRPMVFGMVENLPFKDKSFDFVIASHVLEHSVHPDRFLNELVRVGKAGYIETPDAFFERINPFRFHRSEISCVDGRLMIFKKPSWRHDSNMVDMYERQLKCTNFLKLTRQYPEPFYMRHYWKGKIEFTVVNPETDSGWEIPGDEDRKTFHRSSGRRVALSLARWFWTQGRRNRLIDLKQLLQCPNCSSSNLSFSPDQIDCQSCRSSYAVMNGIPVMKRNYHLP